MDIKHETNFILFREWPIILTLKQQIFLVFFFSFLGHCTVGPVIVQQIVCPCLLLCLQTCMDAERYFFIHVESLPKIICTFIILRVNFKIYSVKTIYYYTTLCHWTSNSHTSTASNTSKFSCPVLSKIWYFRDIWLFSAK